jgi:hypothetical protein
LLYFVTRSCDCLCAFFRAPLHGIDKHSKYFYDEGLRIKDLPHAAAGHYACAE